MLFCRSQHNLNRVCTVAGRQQHYHRPVYRGRRVIRGRSQETSGIPRLVLLQVRSQTPVLGSVLVIVVDV